jgi:C_GCAxxG_C_C family probable redox protein
MNFPAVEQAVAFYQQGYTCAQSILASFTGRYGFPQGLAFKLGEPFGAGMSCTNDMCGCMSGAIMVLGLQYGSTLSNDDVARSYTYQRVQELIRRFKEIHGSIQCPDLLGYYLSDPPQLQAVWEKGLFNQLCPILVRDAAQILADMLEEIPPQPPLSSGSV